MTKSIDNKIFYHGTSFVNVPKIEKEGLRYGYGLLNQGVYITENWKIALMYGNSLYEVKLKPGTRLLDLGVPPDIKILDSLKREFGRALLKADNPNKVIPNNKHLTNIELVNLVRYFFQKWYKLKDTKKIGQWDKVSKAIEAHYRSKLIRHGYHGYGFPTEDVGYVIFNPDKIHSAKLRVQVLEPLYMDNWEDDFRIFNTLDDLIRNVDELKRKQFLKSNSPTNAQK